MKKNILFLFLIIGLVLTSCQNDQKNARQIAEIYLEHMGNYRFEEAKPYVTDEQLDIINQAADIIKTVPEENIKEVLPVTITIEKVTVEDDSAFIDFESKSRAFQNKGYLKMVKKDGQWFACKQGAR